MSLFESLPKHFGCKETKKERNRKKVSLFFCNYSLKKPISSV